MNGLPFMGLWLLKFTLLLLGLWAAHLSLRRANPRWRVWLWRAGSVAAVAITLSVPWRGLLEMKVPVLQPSVGLATEKAGRAQLSSQRLETGEPAVRRVASADARAGDSLLSRRPEDRAENRFPIDSQEANRNAGTRSNSRSTLTGDSAVLAKEPEAATNNSAELRTNQTGEPIPTQAGSAAPSTRAFGVDWRHVCIVIWVIGVMAGISWSLAGALRVRQILRRSTPAQEPTLRLLRPLSSKLGFVFENVCVSDEVQSPSVVGYRHPVILLPKSMLIAEHHDDLRAALAHELAHVQGGDLAWDRILQFVAIAAWFHPLCWRIRTAHRNACERVCDVLASDLLEDREAYKRSLANIALRLAGRSATKGFAMARRPDVVERLRALTAAATAAPLGRLRVLAWLGLVLFAGLLGATSVAFTPRAALAEENEIAGAADGNRDGSGKAKKGRNAPAAPDDPNRVPAFHLIVLSAGDSRPIPNAKIEIRMYGTKLRFQKTFRTDSRGTLRLKYPEIPKSTSMNVTVRVPGRVPYFVNFGRQLTAASVPSQKVVRLKPGVAIGGVVVDEQGAPIAGADLGLRIRVTESNSKQEVFSLLENTKTDEQGRWFLDGAPVPVTSLNIRINHPDFLRTLFPLRAGTDAKYTLTRGWAIGGTIRDPDGRPIRDAIIHPGDDAWGSGKPEATTGDDGKYELKGLQRQATRLTVTAPHLAPQTKTVPLSNEDATVDFQLERGHTIRFKAVDQDGNPAKDVQIVADTWNGMRTIEWRGNTDKNGELTWDGAPAEPVLFDMVSKDFAARRRFPAVQRAEPYEVVLHRRTVVAVWVTDVTTGEAVPAFTAQFGWGGAGRSDASWDYHKTPGRHGKLEFSYGDTQEELYVRVEAPGYVPWVSQKFPIAKRVELNATLSPGGTLNGRVETPAGKPASSARVILVTNRERMGFFPGYRTDGGAQRVDTLKDGSFELQPLADPATPGLLVFVHDTGYKEIPLSEYSDVKPVKLDAWARVEVTVLQQHKPLPGVPVSVDPLGRYGVHVSDYDIEGKTDENGKIDFDKVVPRTSWIGRKLIQADGSGFMVYPARGRHYEIKPGETKLVTIGGSGTLVTGIVKLPPNPPGPRNWSVNKAGFLDTADTNRQSPDRRSYRFLFDDSGKFQVFDIPPGKYKLAISLTEQQGPNLCGTGRKIGSVEPVEFEIVNGQATLDLGELNGEWISFLGPGAFAPEFVAYDADNNNVRLSDLRGKLVLLDFWATWCSPCLAEMPELLALQKKYATDPRFKLVGVALDRDFKSAKNVIAKNGWDWLCLNGGRGTDSLIPSRYEVDALPQKFLIGPDGRIIARQNHVEGLPELIAKTLADLPAQIKAPAAPIGFQPQPIHDAFTPRGAGQVAVVWSEAYFPSGTAVTAHTEGLSLFGAGGKQLRNLPRLTPRGWLTRVDRVTYDRTRRRLLVVADEKLEVIGHDGVRQFRVSIPNLQAVAVDEPTGDIWCLLAAYLNNGETVVLDAEGREKDRLPISGFTLRYSPSADGFWYIGDEAKLVTREGKVVARHALPTEAYTLSAIAVDGAGGCYALETDTPSAVGSHNRLWRFDRQAKATQLAEFPHYKPDAAQYTLPRWLEVVGAEVWLGIQHATDKKDHSKDVWLVRRYDSSGKQLAEFEQHCRAAAADLSGESIWILGDGELIRFNKSGKPIERLDTPSPPRGAYQSAWVQSLK